jgi:hypothetical protein
MAKENDLSGKVGLDVTEFKNGVSQLNREIRVVESGFKAAAAGTEDWSKNSDTLKARIDSLTQIVELQRKKVDATKEAYEKVAAEKGANSKAAQDLAIKLNNETQALNKSELGMKQATAALDKLGDESDEASRKTVDLSGSLDKMGDAAKRGSAVAAKAVAAVGLAAAAAVAGVFKLTTSAGKAADELITMSNKSGISTDQLQKMQYAARFVDVEVETMTGSMMKLTKTMDNARNGNKDAAAAYSSLGVEVTNADGSLRDSQDVWLETINALGKVSNETERNALGMKIFGKSAAELNPLIVAGGDAIAQLGAEAEKMGLIMSKESVEALGQFDDKMQVLEASTKGLGNAIAIAALPAMGMFVDTVQDLATAVLKGVQSGDWTGVTEVINTAMGNAVSGISTMIANVAPEIVPILGNIVQTIADTAPALVPVLVSTALMLLDTIIGFILDNSQMLIDTGIETALSLIDGLIAALPQLIPAAVMIIVQLGIGLIQALPQLIAMLPQIFTGIKDGLVALDWGEIGKQIINGIKQGIIDAAKALATAVVEAAKAALNAAKSFLGIKSPSTVFRGQVGAMIGAGMALGITDKIPAVNSAMNKLNQEITSGSGIKTPSVTSQTRSATAIGSTAVAGKNIMMPITIHVRTAAEAARELNILEKQLASQIG